MSETLEQLAEAITARFGEQVARVPSTCGELTFEVASAGLVDVCRALRDEESFRFEQLIDVAGVDYLAWGRDEWTTESATSTGFSRGRAGAPVQAVPRTDDRRFAAVYHLLSVATNRRLRLRAWCESMGRQRMSRSMRGLRFRYFFMSRIFSRSSSGRFSP